MLENGVEPYCTLYHWDLPQALQEKGGWENPDTAQAFADYSGYVASKLSDRIHQWMTMNEIRSFTQAGYGFNLHAPATPIALLATPEFAIHKRLIDSEPRRQPRKKGHQRLAVRFSGSEVAQHLKQAL